MRNDYRHPNCSQNWIPETETSKNLIATMRAQNAAINAKAQELGRKLTHEEMVEIVENLQEK